MAGLQQALLRIEAGKKKFSRVGRQQREMLAIREGRFEDVAPGMLPEGLDSPMAANFIDIAATAAAEAMSPLPSFSCSTPNMNTEAARKAADRRTRVVNHYIQHSRLGEFNISAADSYNTYGFAAYYVEPDYKAKTPCIYVADVLDSMYHRNRRGETIWFAQRFRRNCMELAFEYEDHYQTFIDLDREGTHDVEVIRYWDDEHQLLIVPEKSIQLHRVENAIKRCPVRIIERHHIGEMTRGAYDDLPGVQIARFLMAKYTLETAEQVAHAPIAMPDDVQEMAMGPFATMRSETPQHIRRVDLGVPNTPFLESQTLGQELQVGARHSELRDGATDANIITGKGVQALMAGYDMKIKVGQGHMASGLTDIISMCLEMDEALWPNLEKSIRGMEDGAPFEVKYRPSRDISGDYTCSVSYGMTAGLDPNRALVFLLQLQTAGDLSRDTVMRQLPFDVNVSAELRKIAVEQHRESLTMAIASLGQAIPAMATQGADPTPVVAKMAAVIAAIEKGDAVEVAVTKAFEPAPPPPQDPASDPMAAAGGAPQDPMAALLGGGGAPPQGAGPEADILRTLAGMSPGGAPQLSASVRRERPA